MMVVVLVLIFTTNRSDDANCSAGDRKIDCGDDLNENGCNSNDDRDVDNNGGVDSNIGKGANSGGDKSKVDWSEETAVDDGNSNIDDSPNDDGGGDTNYMVRTLMAVMVKVMMVLMDLKMVKMMMIVVIL